jgi:hypothetical protein
MHRDPKAIGNVRLIPDKGSVPDYPKHALFCSPYSHSILSTHGNALIYKSKFFLTLPEVRTTSRQNFSLMISKENSRDSNSATFHRLSTTIGRFLAPSTI